MKEKPNKENSLYLTIKQVYFDEIIAGTKKEEYRQIKDTTFKRYIDCDEKGYPYISDSVPEDAEIDILMYNNGEYPFFPKPYQYLSLAVGYAKERDTAIVEVVDITFLAIKDEDGKAIRYNIDEEKQMFVEHPDGFLADWYIVYHLGEIIEVKRKKS